MSSTTTTQPRLQGRRAGPRGHEPDRHRQELKDNRAAVGAYEQLRRGSAQITAGVKQAVPGREVGVVPDGLRRRRGERPGQPDRRAAEGGRASPRSSRTRSSSRSTTTPEFIGATAVWPSLGGSAHAGATSSSASSTRASGPSIRCSRRGMPPPPAGPARLPVRRRQRRRPPRPAVHLQQQADRRVRLDGHLHGQLHRRRTPTSSATTRRACARPATRRVTARTRDDRRRRLRQLGDALRRRARPGLRYRPRRARDHLPRLPRRGLLQLRLGRRGRAGDHRRRRRDQLLDLGRREPVHRRRSSSPSSTRSTRGSPSTPRPATAARAPAPPTTAARG